MFRIQSVKEEMPAEYLTGTGGAHKTTYTTENGHHLFYVLHIPKGCGLDEHNHPKGDWEIYVRLGGKPMINGKRPFFHLCHQSSHSIEPTDENAKVLSIKGIDMPWRRNR